MARHTYLKLPEEFSDPLSGAPKKLWHGTTERNRESIALHGLEHSVFLNWGEIFGPAFYTSRCPRFAFSWASKQNGVFDVHFSVEKKNGKKLRHRELEGADWTREVTECLNGRPGTLPIYDIVEGACCSNPILVCNKGDAPERFGHQTALKTKQALRAVAIDPTVYYPKGA